MRELTVFVRTAFALVLALALSTAALAGEPERDEGSKGSRGAETSEKEERASSDTKEGETRSAGEEQDVVEAAKRANEARVDPKGLPTKTSPETGREVIVITNETLERFFSAVPQGSRAAARSASGRSERQAASARRARTASADKEAGASSRAGSGGKDREAEIASIKQEIARLRRRIQSLRNPYLPRVERTEEEKQREEGKDQRERIALVEKRLVELQERLARLQGAADR
jgi:hypothetical protein